MQRLLVSMFRDSSRFGTAGHRATDRCVGGRRRYWDGPVALCVPYRFSRQAMRGKRGTDGSYKFDGKLTAMSKRTRLASVAYELRGGQGQRFRYSIEGAVHLHTSSYITYQSADLSIPFYQQLGSWFALISTLQFGSVPYPNKTDTRRVVTYSGSPQELAGGPSRPLVRNNK